MLKRLGIALVFGIAFAYIESAVVVYLRVIFHPQGFTFPLEVFGVTPEAKRLLLTEVGREVATLVLILTAAWLFGRVWQERTAYFLVIFAVGTYSTTSGSRFCWIGRPRSWIGTFCF